MKRLSLVLLMAALSVPLGTSALSAEDAPLLRPFVLSAVETGELEKLRGEIVERLTGAGFEVVGRYEPYEGATVVVVTSEELKKTATRSAFGGYGAVQRVSLTEVEGKVQVVWTDPVYMAHVYRMDGDGSSVKEKMEAALGNKEAIGSRKGLTAKKLKKYHYMAMMPYFDDHDELASFESHAAALEAVEKGLEASPGTDKVYRVDIPGKEETLFGAAILTGKGADGKVMEVIDTGPVRQTPHLPYEVLVSGGRVFALHGKFRIALNFPDLGMGTFMKISGAPSGIKKTLKAAIKGQ